MSCLCRTRYTYDSGREDLTTLYLVPVAPGVTRAFNKFVFRGVPSNSKKIFNFLAKNLLSSGFFHAFGHGLVDQVFVLLSRPTTQMSKVANKPALLHGAHSGLVHRGPLSYP